MPKRFRLTRRFPVAMTEDGYRRLTRFAILDVDVFAHAISSIRASCVRGIAASAPRRASFTSGQWGRKAHCALVMEPLPTIMRSPAIEDL